MKSTKTFQDDWNKISSFNDSLSVSFEQINQKGRTPMFAQDDWENCISLYCTLRTVWACLQDDWALDLSVITVNACLQGKIR